MTKARLLAVILACCTLLPSQESGPVVSGLVRDATGGVIENADVIVHWNCALPEGSGVPGAPKDVMVKTDKFGRFSATVAPGFYDVCVHATAFSPQCTTVKATKEKAVTYNPRMNLNALISSEIADDMARPANSKKRKK